MPRAGVRKIPAFRTAAGELPPEKCLIPDIVAVFSFPQSGSALLESVEKHGIINPVIVAEQNGSYTVICGAKRLHAARELGLAEIPARVLRENNLRKRDIFEIAFEENASVRKLNTVEIAGVVTVLADFFNESGERIADRYLHRLDNHAGSRSVAYYRALFTYNTGIKRYLVRWNVPISTAGRLSLFKGKERADLFAVIEKLQLHGGRLKQFIEYSADICARDAVTVKKLFSEPGIASLPNNEKMTPGQKQAKVIDWLHARRYPKLTELYRSFCALAGALDNVPAGTVQPPHNFEGNKLGVHFSFTDVNELDALCSALRDESNRTKIQRLLNLL